MKVTVRQMRAPDRAAWAEMRAALWPEEPLQAHVEWIDEIIGSKDAWGFVAETIDGAPAGFAELAIRKYANGCETRPVPFLEGIWVKAAFRRQGIGNALIAHAGAFLAARGFREIGSASEIDSRSVQAYTLRWGFSVTDRVVLPKIPGKPGPLTGRSAPTSAYFFIVARNLSQAAIPALAACSSTNSGSPATPTAPTRFPSTASGTPPPTR